MPTAKREYVKFTIIFWSADKQLSSGFEFVICRGLGGRRETKKMNGISFE
jgi:hypothetical protein